MQQQQQCSIQHDTRQHGSSSRLIICGLQYAVVEQRTKNTTTIMPHVPHPKPIITTESSQMLRQDDSSALWSCHRALLRFSAGLLPSSGTAVAYRAGKKKTMSFLSRPSYRLCLHLPREVQKELLHSPSRNALLLRGEKAH